MKTRLEVGEMYLTIKGPRREKNQTTLTTIIDITKHRKIPAQLVLTAYKTEEGTHLKSNVVCNNVTPKDLQTILSIVDRFSRKLPLPHATLSERVATFLSVSKARFINLLMPETGECFANLKPEEVVQIVKNKEERLERL